MTAISSTYKHNPSVMSEIIDGRTFLSGRILKRYLSQQLIIILLLLTPITLSTDNLPNFQPECETSSSLNIKQCLNSARFCNSGLNIRKPGQLRPAPHYFSALTIIPVHLLISFVAPGRAPPA
ncbi:MAG: hypothetical protein GJV46_12460 [Geobacter sp.]|nr:hypothetical protein [Geobacter sp.]